MRTADASNHIREHSMTFTGYGIIVYQLMSRTMSTDAALRPSKRKSSFFARTRQSFVRSDGKRGASPATLRGTKGADFENYGKIHRGVDGVTCGCFGGSSEKSTDRLILIKGPFCFIFENENSPSPKYAIGLQNMRDAVHGAGSSLRTSSAGFAVLLTTSLGDTEYEISFTLEAIAREFAATVQTQAAAAVTETVRKRLGHEHLLHKRSSVRYAEGVALKKIVDQPDAPVSTQEVLGNMPSPGAF